MVASSLTLIISLASQASDQFEFAAITLFEYILHGFRLEIFSPFTMEIAVATVRIAVARSVSTFLSQMFMNIELDRN